MNNRTTWPDLSAHPDADLEWWFVQGFLDLQGLGRRDFMLALFRQARADGRGDVHMALISTLDPETGRHDVDSQISPQFFDNFLAEAPGQLGKWGAEDLIAQAFIAELAESGPPRPIRLDPAPAGIAPDPFEATWGDLRLRQSGDRLNVRFALPEDGQICAFEARSQAGWMTEDAVGGADPVGTMAYHSCPRLDLSGLCGSHVVSGEVWIDHQWGDFAWFRGSGDTPRLLGWDWLGINLDCGTDLIVMAHRDMKTREQVAAYAYVMEPGQPPRRVADVDLTPSRHWLSPRTMIDYPVAWTIAIPSLNAELVFQPTAEDQEIPVFGFITAIWEGAGAVTGSFNGTPVSGRARLELQGYGYVHEFKRLHDRWIDRVDANIAAFLPRTLDDPHLAHYLGQPRWRYDAAAQTRMLAQPAWDLMSRGGKHWRPVFGLLLLQALGVAPEPFETALSVIPELAHTGSIIIDDIEDASEKRRGETAIHLRYGVPTAINAANSLYFLPLLTVANHPHLTPGQRAEIHDVFIEMFVQAHFGQGQDLYWSALAPERRAALWRQDNLGDLILQCHLLKTAAPVRVTAEFAAIIADVDHDTRAAIRRFAETVGVAFQIVDDVKDLSATEDLGKTSGEDIRAGKLNYAVYQATRLLKGPQRHQLFEILGCEGLRNTDAGITEAIDLVNASGAPAACRAYARDLIDRDWPAFSRVLPASRHKMTLRLMLTKLISQPFGIATCAGADTERVG